MKLFLLGALFSLNLYASIAFEVEGLIEQNQQVILLPQGEKVKISYFSPGVESCSKGRFLIVNSLVEPEQYELIKIVRCDQNLVCPKIFEPVCGETDSRQWTFGNACELYEAGAIFINYGACEFTPSASGIK
ncbi:MAG: Kazal-type serine protease inhibitor family protein [Bacteriovoracaceae bacterium]